MTGPATRRSHDARRAALLAGLVLVSVVAGLPVPAAESPSDAGGTAGGDPAESAVQAIETCRTIETPGRYELVADLTEGTRACIVIAASDVHLDGAGHTIDTRFEGDAVAVVGEDVTNVTVENLVVDDVQEGIRVGVRASSSVEDLTIRNNEIDSRTAAINVTVSGSATDATVGDVTVANNDIEGGNEGVLVEIEESGWTVHNLSVRDNDVRSDDEGVDVTAFGDDVAARDFEFRNNTVDSGDHGIELIADGTGESVTGIDVVGNDVRSEIGYRSGAPVRIVANDPNQDVDVTVADNRLNATDTDGGNQGVFVWADGDGTEATATVTNNTVGPLTGQAPPDTGIRFSVDGENQNLDVTVRNNTVAGADQGIELGAGPFSEDSTVRSTIADNDLTAPRGIEVEVDGPGNDVDLAVERNRLDVTSAGFELDADDDGVALTVTVADNVVPNGDTGADLQVGTGGEVDVSLTGNELVVDGAAVVTTGPVDGIVLRENRLDGGRYGVRNDNTTSGYVDARNNDWGSPDGPDSDGQLADPVTGTLADGEGSNVTELSDGTANVRFDPWTGKSEGSDATPIDSCTVIREPGHYELTGNVTDESSYICIRITASNVTLDGNGYTVDGVDREGGSAGIVVGQRPRRSLAWGPAGADEGIENVTVRNVRSVRWGAGVRLRSSVGPVVDVRISGVRAERSYGGIVLDRGTNVTVRDSVVRNTSSQGIVLLSTTGVTVRNNRVIDSGFGIDVDDSSSGTVVRDNVVVGSDRGGVVITASGTVVRNNTVRDSETGLRIYGFGESNVTAVGNTVAENLVGIQVGPFLGASSFRDNVVRSNAVGLLLNGARNHTFEGTTFADNGGWSLRAIPSTDDDTDQSATNNSFTDVTFAGTGGEFSFTVTDVEFRPAVEFPSPPDGTADVGVFFRAQNTSDAGALDLTVTYDGAAAEGVDEETLSVWRYDGDWTDRGGSVDPAANTVSKTITSFSTFALLGEESSGAEPVSSCTVIDEPGEYVLNESITNAEAETCIEIRSSDVVFDGGGYTIDGVNRADFSTAVEVNASSTVSNVTVRNVALTGWHSGVVVGDYSGTGVEDVIVETLTVDDSKSGVIVGAGTDVVVRNSVVRNALFMGISVSDTSNVIVRNNTLENASSGINVNEGAVDTVVRDNVLTDNEDHGISVVGSDTRVLNNTLRSNERGIRIGTIYEGTVTVSDNAVFDSNRSGISVSFVESTVFENNTLSGNRIGIDLDGSQNHTFRNTTFDGNTEWAVRATEYFSIQSAKNNTFVGTTFADTPGEFTFTVRNVALRPGADADIPSDTADVGVFLTANATGEEFSSGVNLSVTYDEAAASDVAEETLSVWRYDGEWTDLGGVVDADANVVSKNVSLDDTVALAVLGDPATGTDVVVEETTAPVEEGETLRVAATVRNTGDEPVEEEVSLVVGDAVRDTATVALEPGETTTVELAWATGEGDAGEYTAIVAGEDDTDETAVSVEPAAEEPALSVAIASTNAPVTERDPLVVAATLENTGDEPVEEEVSLVVGDAVRDTATVALEPGETTTVELAWQTESGDAGTYTAAVRGGGDTDATEVSVEPPSSGPDLSVLVEEATSPVTAGETVEIVAVVENGGEESVSESVTLSVEGEVVDETTVAVGAGERVRVELLWRTTEGDAGERVPVVTVGDASDGAIVRVESSNRAPRVRIARTPQVPAPGEAVTFEAVASDPDGTVEGYEWRIDGEVVSTERSFTWTFDGTGRRNVSLVVTDDDGASNATSEPVDVAVLSVDLWHAPATPVTGESVSLVAGTTLSNPAEARYEWTVDGEETFTTERPYASFAFEDPGRHEVTVAVVGPDGQRETDVVNVTVEGREDDPPGTTPAPTTTEPPPTTDPPETTAPPDDRTTAPGTRTTAPPTRTTGPETTTAPSETTGTRTPRETTAPESPPTTAPDRRTTAPGTDTGAPATTDRDTGDGPSTTDGTADETAGPSATSDTAAGTDPSEGTGTGGTQPSDGEVPGLGVGAALLALVALLALRRR